MQRNQDNPYYRETCRDDVRVVHFGDADGNGARASRSASTCIYYLLCDGAYSAWHRIRSDEVLQQVVPASRWFAAKCVDPSGFARNIVASSDQGLGLDPNGNHGTGVTPDAGPRIDPEG